LQLQIISNKKIDFFIGVFNLKQMDRKFLPFNITDFYNSLTIKERNYLNCIFERYPVADFNIERSKLIKNAFERYPYGIPYDSDGNLDIHLVRHPNCDCEQC